MVGCEHKSKPRVDETDLVCKTKMAKLEHNLIPETNQWKKPDVPLNSCS